MWSELLWHCPWLPPWEVFFYEGGPSHCPHYSKPTTWSKLFLFCKLISNSVLVSPLSRQPKMPKLLPRGDTRNPHDQASDKDRHTLLNTPSFHSHPHFRLYPPRLFLNSLFCECVCWGRGGDIYFNPNSQETKTRWFMWVRSQPETYTPHWKPKTLTCFFLLLFGSFLT